MKKLLAILMALVMTLSIAGVYMAETNAQPAGAAGDVLSTLEEAAPQPQAATDFDNIEADTLGEIVDAGAQTGTNASPELNTENTAAAPTATAPSADTTAPAADATTPAADAAAPAAGTSAETSAETLTETPAETATATPTETLTEAPAGTPAETPAETPEADPEELPLGEEYEEIFPDWNEGSAVLKTLVDYVESVTDEASPDFIPERDRIAVFDMDGTLYGELFPTYFEYYMLAWRILKDPTYSPDQEMLALGREIRESVTTNNFAEDLPIRHAIGAAKAYAGMTMTQFADYVNQFLIRDVDGFEGMTYGEAVYLPMVEVVEYLQENGFKTYVCSGSDRFICRYLLEGMYDFPYENIIGMDVEMRATGQNDVDGLDYVYSPSDSLIRSDKLLIKNLKMNKVSMISKEIGHQPVLSFGNSSGDVSMHNYTITDNPYKSAAFMLIADNDVLDYGHSEKGPELRQKWEESGYNVISMKDDFRTIYGDNVVKTGTFHWEEELTDDYDAPATGIADPNAANPAAVTDPAAAAADPAAAAATDPAAAAANPAAAAAPTDIATVADPTAATAAPAEIATVADPTAAATAAAPADIATAADPAAATAAPTEIATVADPAATAPAATAAAAPAGTTDLSALADLSNSQAAGAAPAVNPALTDPSAGAAPAVNPALTDPSAAGSSDLVTIENPAASAPAQSSGAVLNGSELPMNSSGGFMSMADLQAISNSQSTAGTVDPNAKQMVIVINANVRDKPHGELIRVIPEGTVVNVYGTSGENNDWYEIEIFGMRGYVYKDLLREQ